MMRALVAAASLLSTTNIALADYVFVGPPSGAVPQAANLFYAGPSSGAATIPTFRAITAADLPATPPQAAHLFNAGPSSGAAAIPTFRAITAGDLPATLSQAANLFYAGPSSGAAAVPAFRGITAADLPATPPQAANLFYAGPSSGTTAIPTFRGITAADLPAPTPSSWSYCNSMSLSGAVGDGITDDTAVINAYLATLTTGGCVSIPASKWYLINTANLTIPAGVIIQGASSPFARVYTSGANTGGGFYLNPAYTISLQAGAQLKDLAIIRAGLIPNPTAAQSYAAIAQWGSERSIGITLPANIGDQLVEDVFVEGFNTCIKALVGRFHVLRLKGDCYNGFEVTGAGDDHYIDGVAFEPFYSLAISDQNTWARPGIAFNVHETNTGTVITRAFGFMYASAVVLNGTGVGQLSNSEFEWRPTIGNGITGTKGIRLINKNSEYTIDTTIVNTYDTGYSIEGWGGTEVMIRGATVSGSPVAFNLGGQTAVPTTITISGAVSAGSTASATITSAAVAGSPLTITYTAVAGDTLNSVALGLQQAINANQALIKGSIFAGSSGAVVTVYWGQTAPAATVTAGGSLTTATGTIASQVGMSGSIIGADLPVSNTTDFAVQTTVRWWNIIAPFLHTSGTIPATWLTIGATDFTSEQHLRFSGMPWSFVSNASLSACGTSPTVGTSGGSDGDGNITEGSGATGCTLTFGTPWPYTPKCNVTSPTGATITSYTPSSTTLTIVNPTAGQFTYSCRLG